MRACCPYLNFDGQADEAMQTYQRVLGGELRIMRFSDMPPGAGSPPPDCEPSDPKRVMHAMLRFDGGMLMASDAPNSKMAQRMEGTSVSLMVPSADEGRRIFDGLSQGAQVRMPFSQTFWADGFGMLVDRFGTSWMVSGGMREA